METTFKVLSIIRTILCELAKILFYFLSLSIFFVDKKIPNEVITALVMLLGWIIIMEFDKRNEKLDEINKKLDGEDSDKLP